jgi:hypothetical protein
MFAMSTSATIKRRLSPINGRYSSAIRDECFDIPDFLVALLERQVVDGCRHSIEVEFGCARSNGFRPGLKRLDAIAPDLARDSDSRVSAGSLFA